MNESEDTKQNKVETAKGISRRELLKQLVPFGRIGLDAARCTGCSLCILECPTGALTASSGDAADTCRLLFRQARCTACGECLKACPEQCLRLERGLDTDKIDSPPAVLFEDKLVHCRECGAVIGSRAMVERIKSKVAPEGGLATARFELCPDCKAKAQLRRLGRTREHIAG